MTNKKSTKRALITSALAMLMCVAMLIGTTFAWFTDTASTAVNKIQSGNLHVEIQDKTGEKIENLEWVKENGDVIANQEDILWEPGCTYLLTPFQIVNTGNLALKYKIVITGLDGDSLLLDVIKFTYKTASGEEFDMSAEGHLAANGGTTGMITVSAHMDEAAGNKYQDQELKNVRFTVYATQDTVESDSYNNQYDKDAGTAHYTLDEFNALTEIPEDVKVVYLNIGDVSLKDSGVTIGNKNMADLYTGVTGDYYVGQKLDDGRVVSSVWNANTKTYLANTNKPGITLYISGSVNDNPEGGLNQSNSHSLSLIIPDASNVVFTKDFTVNGYFRCSFSWNDNQTLGGGVASHKIQSVLFDHSTFNGIWIQNGSFLADSLTLDGCTFNAYENKVAAKDSNPLWFCNIHSCDVTIKNCNFTASRPVKVVEQTVNGANVTIINNKFDMSLANSSDVSGEFKNDAIMFSTITNTSTLGNVVVSGNEITGANALLTFFNPSQITMANGASFKVSDNTLNGAKFSVEWKTATEYTPNFVK